MKKLTRAELLALFPKAQRYIEQRLNQDCVDGVIVFERTKEPGKDRRTACVFGAPYTIKRWQDAEGRLLGDTASTQMEAVAYYAKQQNPIEAQG